MSSAYGNTTNHWRAYCDYTLGTTNNDLYYAVRIDAAGFQSVAWGFSMSGVSTSVAATGQTTQTGSGSVYSATGATTKNAQVSSKTFTWTKGTSATTKTITVTVSNSSGYMNGTSTLTISVTVPARTSHTVTYNANGGSGAPASQTKWYGSILTLSTTVPTRSDYNFLGWGTSSSATSASYQPGQQYGVDANLALYAVWGLAHTKPAITDLSAVRCLSDGTEDDEGTYAKLSFSWETFDSTTADTLVLSSKLTTASAWTDEAYVVSGSSGTVSTVLAATFDVAYSYDIKVVLLDSSSASTTAATLISQAFFLMDFLAGGEGLALGKAATSAGFEVAMDATFEETTTFTGDVPNMAKFVFSSSRLTGAAYDSSSHQITVMSGTNVSSSDTMTISFPSAFAGVSSVVVSGGDNVGISGTTVVADSVSTSGFEAKRLGGSYTSSWRVNWIAIGWVAL